MTKTRETEGFLKDTIGFLFGTFGHYLMLLFKISPLIILLAASNAAIFHFFDQSKFLEFMLSWVLGIFLVLLGSIIFSYLAINWHRAFAYGTNYKIEDDNQKSSENAFAFFGFTFLISFIASFFPFLSFINQSSTETLYYSLFFIGAVLFLFFTLRISFYFPGKALNDEMTFGKAFRMSSGFLLKIFFQLFIGSILITIITTPVSLALEFMNILGNENSYLSIFSNELIYLFVSYLFALPITVSIITRLYLQAKNQSENTSTSETMKVSG